MDFAKALEKLPDPVRARLSETRSRIDATISQAEAGQALSVAGRISLRYRHAGHGDVLSADERAQSLCFVSRYEHLPTLDRLSVIESAGKWVLGNVGFIRHLLNEYRSIVFNKRDSIYYKRIHTFCHQKLSNRNPAAGLCVTVDHEEDGDITDRFVRFLGQKCRAIKIIVQKSEFDYIYNGILQHSDHDYAKRLWDDYVGGQLNHVFIEHAFLLGYIKECLSGHYLILNELTFPKLGPL